MRTLDIHALVVAVCAVACSSTSSGPSGTTDAGNESATMDAMPDVTSEAEDAAGTSDAMMSSTTDAPATDAPATDATDAVGDDQGPACTYPSYTASEYAQYVDSGAYPNLPCGGCAPDPGVSCSPDGVSPGHRYECWSEHGYPQPPYPSANCATIGISIGAGPDLRDVCCP
jgi:hypothetical protein